MLSFRNMLQNNILYTTMCPVKQKRHFIEKHKWQFNYLLFEFSLFWRERVISLFLSSIVTILPGMFIYV